MNWLRVFFSSLLWVFLMPRIWRSMAGKRAPSEGFVLSWTLLGYGTSLLGLLVIIGLHWAVPLFVVGLILLMPWTVARALFIPLGMSRWAFSLSQLSGWTWGRDCDGGALVGGAWALLHQREPDRERMTALENRRDRMPSLTAGQVLATGLLSAARGDLDSARLLLCSVDEIGVQTTAPAMHALAREWLVVDAVERGAWADVARLAAGPRRTRLTRLLGAVGECYSGRPGGERPATSPPTSPSDNQTDSIWHLWVLWLIAPRRRHTYPLVKRAIADRPAASPPAAPDRQLETNAENDYYADALSAHAHALTRDPAEFQSADFERLGSAWDRALADPDTVALIMRRARELGARSGDMALRALADEVSLDVANMARLAGIRLAECQGESRVLADAQHWLRNDLIRQIELAFDALYNRAAERRELSSMDEWREFVSLRALYRDGFGIGGTELRHLAFPHVHTTVCKLAVWLWNHREEHLMANAMFRSLLDEANAVGDAEAIELQSRNWDETL